MNNRETQKIVDKLFLMQRKDDAFTIEPIIAENYGTGIWLDAIVLKSDVFTDGIREIIEEFDSVFFDSSRGLVIGQD